MPLPDIINWQISCRAALNERQC